MYPLESMLDLCCEFEMQSRKNGAVPICRQMAVFVSWGGDSGISFYTSSELKLN